MLERKTCLVFNCTEMVLKLEAQSLDAQFGSIRGKKIYFAIVVHWCYGTRALTLPKRSTRWLNLLELAHFFLKLSRCSHGPLKIFHCIMTCFSHKVSAISHLGVDLFISFVCTGTRRQLTSHTKLKK